jgi:hypothetical protein
VSNFPLALGDQRHYSATFGGAREEMFKPAKSVNATVPIPEPQYELPSRIVLDFVSNRRLAEIQLHSWIEFVKDVTRTCKACNAQSMPTS